MVDDLNRVHNQYAINAVIDLAPPVDDENAPELAFGYMEDRTIPYREMVYVSASTKPPRIEISFPNPGTPTRYTLITGYRQPQCREVSKWITPAFYNRRTVGLAPEGKDFAILDGSGEPLPTPPGKDLFRP